MESTLQVLGRSLEHWQGLYIVALILAVLSTISIVLFNFHLENKRRLRASNYVYALAACLSVVATLVIITKTRSIDIEKDRISRIQIEGLQREVSVSNASAARANADAKIAYQKAEEARLRSEQTATANSGLRIEVAKQEAETKKATTALASQNQQTAQFAQGLAQQQQGMAQQMQATPSLSDPQVDAIAKLLKPFSGRAIPIHVMMDARSQRLAGRFQQAFAKAGITFDGSATDVGPNYTGVMVVVKNPTPQPHPPLADALRSAIQSVGIQTHGSADPSLKEDEVKLCIGPE